MGYTGQMQDMPSKTMPVEPALESGEKLLARMDANLDEELEFASSALFLTDRRLIGFDPSGKWRDWKRAGLDLVRDEHGGVGRIELRSDRLLWTWRYTLDRDVEARRILDAFRGNEEEEAETEEEETPPPSWTLLRLSRFARPYRNELVLGFLLTLAGTAAAMVPPYLTMPLMDKVLIPFQNGIPIDAARVAFYLSGLLIAALAAWALGWARTYLLARVSERIGADLRVETFRHLQSLSLEYFGGKRTGDLIARIGSETDRINVFLSLHLLDFATDILMIFMTAGILISINPWLALVTLLPLPFIAWMIHYVRDKLKHGFEQSDRVWSEITNVLADTIPGIRVVKAFAQEGREVARFRKANTHNLEVNDKVNTVWSLFGPSVTLLTEIGLLVVWSFGIWEVSKKTITVGMLTAFLAYITRFYTRLDSMSRIVSVTQKAAAGAKRIFDILDHESSVPEPSNPLPIGRIEGAIAVRHAAFRYGHRPILKGVSLSISPGEMIGLVGQSGSGKSTLVNLICRFYDPLEGEIKVDGQDIRSLSLEQYRRTSGWFFRNLSCSSARSRKTSPMESLPRPRQKSWRRRGRRTPMNSSFACPWDTTRWWAKEDSPCPAASASAFPSPGHSSSTRAF